MQRIQHSDNRRKWYTVFNRWGKCSTVNIYAMDILFCVDIKDGGIVKEKQLILTVDGPGGNVPGILKSSVKWSDSMPCIAWERGEYAQRVF